MSKGAGAGALIYRHYRPMLKTDASASKRSFQVQNLPSSVLVRRVALPQNDTAATGRIKEHHGAQHFIAEQRHDMRPSALP